MGGRDDVRETWETVSGAWEAHHARLDGFTAPIRRRLIDDLAPDPDGVVLDLAAGTGATSCAVSSLVRRVRCTDLSLGMVRAARRRAESLGISNIAFDVVEAEALPYASGSVARIACQMGLMLMLRPRDVLRECRRVLRPSGRLALSVWGSAERNPWLVMGGAALLSHGHSVGGDPFGPGGVFSLSDPHSVSMLLSDAGFADIYTETLSLTDRYESFEEYWRVHTETSGPVALVVSRLDDETLKSVQDACRGFCEPFRVGVGFEFPGEAVVAVAGS